MKLRKPPACLYFDGWEGLKESRANYAFCRSKKILKMPSFSKTSFCWGEKCWDYQKASALKRATERVRNAT